MRIYWLKDLWNKSFSLADFVFPIITDHVTTVAHNCHGNINLATAISIWPRQNQFGHDNFNLATAKSIWPRQFQFGLRKINLATTISIYTRDFHDVILARNMLWESIQHGGEWTEQLLKMFCANCGFTVSGHFVPWSDRSKSDRSKSDRSNQ